MIDRVRSSSPILKPRERVWANVNDACLPRGPLGGSSSAAARTAIAMTSPARREQLLARDPVRSYPFRPIGKDLHRTTLESFVRFHAVGLTTQRLSRRVRAQRARGRLQPRVTHLPGCSPIVHA